MLVTIVNDTRALNSKFQKNANRFTQQVCEYTRAGGALAPVDRCPQVRLH
jgi:hypothetical protein